MAETVTVVIPTLNRPDHLRRAVASVRRQTGVSCRIIIVDDASECDMSDEFKDQNDVVYVRNEQNRGGGYSRNRGLELAKGEYVNFLDDDDEFLEGKLVRQIDKFTESSVDNLGMVSCHIRDRRSGKEEILKNDYKGDIHLRSLKGYTVKLTTTMLFRTEAVRSVGGFDESLPANQEYDLIIRFSKHYGVDYVDDILAQANRSSGQISMDFEKKRIGAKMLFNKFYPGYREAGWLLLLRMQLKLGLLLFRFWVGRQFGETAYRLLLRSGK